MNIPWKIKSRIFGFIDFLNTDNFLYFLQKHVTKRSQVGGLEIPTVWERHKAYLGKYNALGKVFEFGAGKTLGQNLYLSNAIKKQIVVDLNPMIDFHLVENVRLNLSKFEPLRSKKEIISSESLSSYGIEYRAPYDAAVTDFKSKSIDACISTDTLEHIPAESIVAIFEELYRIIKDDGIISARIDYSDHYAHTDSSISLLNYLKFKEDEWSKYNHNCHFQNRLRHYDYLQIFHKCGFYVVEEELAFEAKSIPAEILNEYQNKDQNWKATSSHIVLKKVLN